MSGKGRASNTCRVCKRPSREAAHPSCLKRQTAVRVKRARSAGRLLSSPVKESKRVVRRRRRAAVDSLLGRVLGGKSGDGGKPSTKQWWVTGVTNHKIEAPKKPKPQAPRKRHASAPKTKAASYRPKVSS